MCEFVPVRGPRAHEVCGKKIVGFIPVTKSQSLFSGKNLCVIHHKSGLSDLHRRSECSDDCEFCGELLQSASLQRTPLAYIIDPNGLTVKFAEDN
jgi:hypothetical protein